jgi:hypothetical protein
MQPDLKPWGGQSWPQPAFQPALGRVHRSRLKGGRGQDWPPHLWHEGVANAY